MTEGVHLFGIRHHGPGSARSLVHELEELAPDIVLIEGPPEGDSLLPLAAREDLRPPVALLVYATEHAGRAVLYPFADFSPEWQAIRFALRRGVAVRFIDLPLAIRLASLRGRSSAEDSDTSGAGESDGASGGDEGTGGGAGDSAGVDDALAAADPLDAMASAAGYSDTERWWDHLVESRAGRDRDVFAAIHEMMHAVRAVPELKITAGEARREAWMRRAIRVARTEGFSRIAVVCGAYHTPALAVTPAARDDDALLRGLPKTKTSASWVPWSYARLSYASGYGAGIASPVWYELLWRQPAAPGAAWMTRAARLMREEDLSVSSAHAIEACRLADALAALRGRPAAGLPEYNDAALTVLGDGADMSMRLIARRWHFDDRLGTVPADFPSAPLQQDLTAHQRRLRLPPKLEERLLDLDLREAIDRGRSELLRRLRLLDVPWGIPDPEAAGSKGTFHEWWQVRWQPDFAVSLIEASRYGHTIEAAAVARVIERSRDERSLAALIELLQDALFANLGDAVAPLVQAVEERGAVAADVGQLLEAVPPLAALRRYGNVRGTDVSLVDHILAVIAPRAAVALPAAMLGLDDDAARALWQKVHAAVGALRSLGDPSYLDLWFDALQRIAGNELAHPLMAGYGHRILYDAGHLPAVVVAAALSQALSPANDPPRAAAWLEGLLAGAGVLLVHDDRLRSLVDGWVRGVSDAQFVQVLPLLRRTFSSFPPAERRALGDRLRRGTRDTAPDTADIAFDEPTALGVLPVLRQIWGVE